MAKATMKDGAVRTRVRARTVGRANGNDSIFVDTVIDCWKQQKKKSATTPLLVASISYFNIETTKETQ